MLNSPAFAYRTICIVLLRSQPFYKQCIAFVYFCITLFYKYMFINDMLHPYTLVRSIRQGLQYPPIWCGKSKHFNKYGTQTYSIICIGSESCPGSIVGFARLLCFGAFRSVVSAKVALGEL